MDGLLPPVVPHLELWPYDLAAARRQARAFDRRITELPDDVGLVERLRAMESVAAARDHAQLTTKATKLRLEAVGMRESAGLEVPYELLERVGVGLSGVNQHRKARPHLERALASCEAGSDQAALGRVAFRLGVAYGCGAPRKLGMAALLYERAVELLSKVHGEDHPSLLGPLGMLTDLERVRGRHDIARRCAERGLGIARRVFGFGAGKPVPLLANGLPAGTSEVTLFVHAIARGLPMGPERADLERRFPFGVRRSADEIAAAWGSPLPTSSAG